MLIVCTCIPQNEQWAPGKTRSPRPGHPDIEEDTETEYSEATETQTENDDRIKDNRDSVQSVNPDQNKDTGEDSNHAISNNDEEVLVVIFYPYNTQLICVTDFL